MVLNVTENTDELLLKLTSYLRKRDNKLGSKWERKVVF